MKKFYFALVLLSWSVTQAQILFDSYQSTNVGQYNFGKAIAAFNNTVISASGSPFLPTRGKLEIFNANSSDLMPTQTFQPADGTDGDNYGFAVDINENYIAVGAPLYDSQFSNSGAVYVYKKTNGNWSLLQKIIPQDGIALGNFGYTVKLHEDQLFIGSPNFASSSNTLGKIYIYNLDQTTATFTQELYFQGRNGVANAFSLNSGKLVLSYSQSGTKYIETFIKTGNSWISEGRFSVDVAGYYFRNLRLDNDYLYAQFSDVSDTGAFIRVYKNTNNNWEYESEIMLSEPNYSITDFEVTADKMIIGYGYSRIGGKSPAVFYKKINEAWLLQEFFFGDADPSDSDSFGSNIVFDNGKIYIGAPAEGATSTGKIYYTDNVLSIADFDANSGIFPNPTSGKLTINDPEVKNAEVYNIMGQKVLSQQIQFNEISLESLQNGLYVVKLNDNYGKSTSYKIIKN